MTGFIGATPLQYLRILKIFTLPFEIKISLIKLSKFKFYFKVFALVFSPSLQDRVQISLILL